MRTPGAPHESAIDALYEQMSAGIGCWAVDSFGRRRRLPAGRWLGGSASTPADRFADEVVVGACTEPTLDLGCGPGRFTAALTRRGIPALGVDLSAVAVEMTTRRGGFALRGDAFAPLPGRGGWGRVLLADGNIGIGGDPVRILRRARELLTPAGLVIAEVDPAQSGFRTEHVRWESDHIVGAWHSWSRVGSDAVGGFAAAAGLRLIDSIVVSGRSFTAMCIA
ncbi:methyltransferase domain-containing protein [Nocardia sp. NPDC058058]|uniref:methyltransferase domain-containing protein n=1 Tax=Nocardia sp. NPDC058058 TaxID=3346317 RepID=UPI0036D919EB